LQTVLEHILRNFSIYMILVVLFLEIFTCTCLCFLYSFLCKS